MAPPYPPSTAAASDSKHTDLNIPQFITPVDTEEAALQWQKWRQNFEMKTAILQSHNPPGQAGRPGNIWRRRNRGIDRQFTKHCRRRGNSSRR